MPTILADMPREKKPPTETVRLAKDLVRRINRLAAHVDKSVPDWLAAKLLPIVESDEAKMLAEMQAERGEKRKPRS